LSWVEGYHPVEDELEAAGDKVLDEVYIPPPDYSMTEELMAVVLGIFVQCVRF